MEFIFFIAGLIVGVILTLAIKSKDKIYGVIDVDHRNEMCRFHISSDELSDRKCKKATFKVNHEANISREEQAL